MTLNSKVKSIKFFYKDREQLLGTPKHKIIDMTKRVLNLYNRKMQQNIDLSVENEALKRKVIYLEKRIIILNAKDNNYHNFTYPDKTIKRQERLKVKDNK